MSPRHSVEEAQFGSNMADHGRSSVSASEDHESALASPIPTYAEANTLQPPPPFPHAHHASSTTLQPAPPFPSSPADAPPAYAVLDAQQTTFMIYGTFIHTPAGPAYQLSSPLDQRGVYFRIRRLSARESAQVGVTPVAFDKGATLYEVND